MHRMATTTAAVTLKNVPAELYDELKASAVRNRRSLNQEAIAWLEQAAPRHPRDPRAILDELTAWRESRNLPYLTEDFLDRAKREGRK